MKGKVAAISVSRRKGEKKRQVEFAMLRRGWGIVGDAHAGTERQVSLLSLESVLMLGKQGLPVGPGDFAENILTEGLNLSRVKVGDRLYIGERVILEVTQRGKECHDPCWIYRSLGRCIMPEEGVFAKVVRGGTIRKGDEIEWGEREER